MPIVLKYKASGKKRYWIAQESNETQIVFKPSLLQNKRQSCSYNYRIISHFKPLMDLFHILWKGRASFCIFTATIKKNFTFCRFNLSFQRSLRVWQNSDLQRVTSFVCTALITSTTGSLFWLLGKFCDAIWPRYNQGS